jgi:hypothetical protein
MCSVGALVSYILWEVARLIERNIQLLLYLLFDSSFDSFYNQKFSIMFSTELQRSSQPSLFRILATDFPCPTQEELPHY